MQVESLYRKYAPELLSLSRKLREQYHAMRKRGYNTTFGDVEGEILYLTLRESQPKVVFEISPDTGWSTNYILAALTANGTGTLHSFELKKRIGCKSSELVIRGNQCREWDQNRLVLHLGDARHTTEQVPGRVNFVLLDSCHEDFFAQWYIEKLFPRINGHVFLQDISFVDEQEASSEAREFLAWAAQQRLDISLVGSAEANPAVVSARKNFAERRNIRSNAVFFALPPTLDHPPIDGRFPREDVGPAVRIRQAMECGEPEEADKILNEVTAELLSASNRGNRHRLFFMAAEAYRKLGNRPEADRCFHRALGSALLSDPYQREKGLAELALPYLKRRKWILGATTLGLALVGSRGRNYLLDILMSKSRRKQ